MRLAFALALLLSLTPAAFAEPVERGALRLENVPETAPGVAASLRRYVNTSFASLADWLPGDAGVLILTRVGATVQLHRVERAGEPSRQITFFDQRVGEALPRPGASTILLSRDTGGDERFAGLLFDPATGVATEFTEPGTRNEGFVWRRDGALAAWSRAPLDAPDYDVFVGDPSDPASRRLVLRGEGAITPLEFSPDGSKLLLGRYVSIQERQLFLLDLASTQLTPIAPAPNVYFGGGQFTPDGRAIIATSDRDARVQRLVRIDLASNRRSFLTPELEWDVELFALSDDGRTLAYSINEAGRSTLHLIDMRQRREMIYPVLPPGVISNLAFDDNGRRLAFTIDRPVAPADIYAWDLDRHQLTRWTISETGGAAPADFVEPRVISWRSFDRRTIQAYLYAPRTPGPHPVIISLHGGPESQARPRFNATLQYWVNELGAVVIQPNVRGSSGYGKSFLALDDGPLRENAVRDVGALLDWIATQPDLDASRVAVYGASYGGYLALASMTEYNDRLAGGVDVVGIANFVSFLERTSGYRRDLRRAEYGDERDPNMRDALTRLSPLTRINAITKPILVVHGVNDPRVPVSEAQQVLEAVRANGGEAWLMLALNEGHGFARAENQQAQREAETMFFRRIFALEQGLLPL